MGRKKGRTIESYEKDQKALELQEEGQREAKAERRRTRLDLDGQL